MTVAPTPATNTAGIQVNALVTPQKPISGTCVVTTANSSYADTPTNTALLLAAGTVGQRITKVTALARATPTATECQLYTSTDSGTTKRFIDSALMAAYTVAQTTKQTKVDFGYTEAAPLTLAAGESLYAAIGVSNTGVVFRAEGGAYV